MFYRDHAVTLPIPRAILGFATALVVAGCSALPHNYRRSEHVLANRTLADSTGAAVDRLLGTVNPPLSRDTEVLVVSFADLNELTETTNLGRLIAEQAAERLIQRGYRVPEIRLAKTLHVRSGGEFILSQDPTALKLTGPNGTTEVAAGVVVTGTITSLNGTTYVNFRLIRLSDGIDLAASDLELPVQIVNADE